MLPTDFYNIIKCRDTMNQADFLDFLLTRRSIRTYTAQSIEIAVLYELIRAACSAPSAGNQQPWDFVILDDKQLFRKIPAFHPNAKLIEDADKAILICANKKRERYKQYSPIDCAAATQNLLLAAHAYGLGACWLGIYPREDRMEQMRTLLAIPKHILPFSLIALGYPAEKSRKLDRFDPQRIHINTW